MKGISVYGSFEAYEPVFQRYWVWCYHRIGPLAGGRWYKRRVWKRTSRVKKVVRTDARYDFTGTGKELYKAVIESRRRVPFDYIEVEAKEFLKRPEKYGRPGEWVEWRVVS